MGPSLQWIQFFATFVSTVSTAYPGKTEELMAYGNVDPTPFRGERRRRQG